MSHLWFERAKKIIPGGVNSPVRAFNAVGGEPVFYARGEGAYLSDEKGKRYVDYVCTWGATILGHADACLTDTLATALKNGFGFGAPTTIEVLMAEKIHALMPNIELVRMVNSGTEATMSAIRLARGYTGRDKIIKFAGCYHGHADPLLVQAGSGALTFGVPSSAGVPAAVAADTLVAQFNDLASVEVLFQKYGEQIAAIIVEPVPGNMNLVPPLPTFLPGLRQLCDKYGSVFIMDEVMSGFRVALGGAQALYNVKPDLTTLGKIIGGGLPVGAFGGRREIMEKLSPLGPVYQAGTLSGNPLAMAVGLAQLEAIAADPNFHQRLNNTTKTLMDELVQVARRFNVPFTTHQIGGMFGFAFSEKPIVTYLDVQQSDIERFKKFFHSMLALGINLAPSAYEAGFVTAAHGETEMALTLHAAEKSFQKFNL